MMFFSVDMFWNGRGNLFIGLLPGQHLVRLALNGERGAAEEQRLIELKQRIREVPTDRSTSSQLRRSCA